MWRTVVRTCPACPFIKPCTHRRVARGPEKGVTCGSMGLCWSSAPTSADVKAGISPRLRPQELRAHPEGPYPQAGLTASLASSRAADDTGLLRPSSQGRPLNSTGGPLSVFGTLLPSSESGTAWCCVRHVLEPVPARWRTCTEVCHRQSYGSSCRASLRSGVT